jgi:hypothetical protein
MRWEAVEDRQTGFGDFRTGNGQLTADNGSVVDIFEIIFTFSVT